MNYLELFMSVMFFLSAIVLIAFVISIGKDVYEELKDIYKENNKDEP